MVSLYVMKKKLRDKQLVSRAVAKASQSKCNAKIAALGFNSRGQCVAKSFNQKRFLRKGGGLHAEMILMRESRRKGIVTILICRVGKSGDLLPVDPCLTCAQKAEELGIKIFTVPVDED